MKLIFFLLCSSLPSHSLSTEFTTNSVYIFVCLFSQDYSRLWKAVNSSHNPSHLLTFALALVIFEKHLAKIHLLSVLESLDSCLSPCSFDCPCLIIKVASVWEMLWEVEGRSTFFLWWIQIQKFTISMIKIYCSASSWARGKSWGLVLTSRLCTGKEVKTRYKRSSCMWSSQFLFPIFFSLQFHTDGIYPRHISRGIILDSDLSLNSCI